MVSTHSDFPCKSYFCAEKNQKKGAQDKIQSLNEQLTEEKETTSRLKKNLQDKDKKIESTENAFSEEKKALERSISELRESLNKLRVASGTVHKEEIERI